MGWWKRYDGAVSWDKFMMMGSRCSAKIGKRYSEFVSRSLRVFRCSHGRHIATPWPGQFVPQECGPGERPWAQAADRRFIRDQLVDDARRAVALDCLANQSVTNKSQETRGRRRIRGLVFGDERNPDATSSRTDSTKKCAVVSSKQHSLHVGSGSVRRGKHATASGVTIRAPN